MASNKYQGSPVVTGHPLISVREVTVCYDNTFVALDHVSFDLQPGTLCALVGPNGAGKSTLFKALLGEVRLASGSLLLAQMTSLEARKRGLVAYVPQHEQIDLAFPLSVWDVVMQGRYTRMSLLRVPTAQDRREVQSALEQVGLYDYAHKRIGELSGGQRKRAFVARAIAQKAQILLLDEPYAGVDRRSEAQLTALLREVVGTGITALVAVHNLRAAAHHFDQALVIRQKLLAHGNIPKALAPRVLAEAFDVSHLRAQELVA